MQFQTNLKKYLKKRSEKNWVFESPPSKRNYDFFIIIPAKAEQKYLPFLIESISKQNKKYLNDCLVVIVVNRSEEDPKEVIDNNNQTIEYLNNTPFDFELCYINASNKNNALPIKKAGVGLARKIGADLAIQHSNPSSIICYTDADVILSENYLQIIAEYYSKYNYGCAIVDFEHQKHSDEMINSNIRKYEKFLFKTANDLKSAGSPYGYVTLGSCITCTSSAYIAVGGMNKMKATEDFYFLQDLTKHFGSMNSINNKIVYPSSRISTRVYLGTGYRMKTILEGEKIDELYFSKQSFDDLKQFLLIIKESYELSINQLLDKTNDIPKLNSFLEREGIYDVWDSLINNVDYKKFTSQFHRWFDGLKTIKFLKYFS